MRGKKNPEMFDLMFDHLGSVYLCNGFFSYLGKYKSDILQNCGIPRISTKSDAIALRMHGIEST